MSSRDWDVFCRVIDNYGDAGVCWRLCKDLAARGQRVRLWIDDDRPLQWMGPSDALERIDIRDWSDATAFEASAGGVVIEAFGCELPDDVKARMAACQPAPHWINLEYLSAEDYVERSHGLRSPQWQGPAAGLEKFFFYPGFTSRTGGLLREPGRLATLDAVDAAAWLRMHGLEPRPGERRISLFCYENPALPALLAGLAAGGATLLLACPGPGSRQLRALEAANALPAGLRVHHLPFLTQDEFDELLSTCDLNLVRGEDSFVRAQWAGRPFVWHIYPQDDGAHEAKLEAFMARAFAAMAPDQRQSWRALWRAWNGLEGAAAELTALDIPPIQAAEAAFVHWRASLLAQPDLVTQLQAFVAR